MRGVKNQAPQRNSVFFDACCLQMVCLIYQILQKCKCLVCTTTHVSSVPWTLGWFCPSRLWQHWENTKGLDFVPFICPVWKIASKTADPRQLLKWYCCIWFLAWWNPTTKHALCDIQVTRHSQLQSVFQWNPFSWITKVCSSYFLDAPVFKRMFLAELLCFFVVDWPIVGGSVLYVLRCFVLLCFGVLSFVVTIQFWSDLSVIFCGAGKNRKLQAANKA